MPLTEPPVLKPVGSGDDTQSVDLPALDHLAEAVGALETPLRNALDSLGNVDVRPGGFYHANQIRAKVTGQDGDAGLVQSYSMTLTNLIEGIVDIRDGLRRLREEYAKAERDASISAADVTQAMKEAEQDFNFVTQVRA
ncbi:hypothetical protein [Streptomyces sp. NBC_00151]|jgi:hypothetical protein|uniref:hypothetical protein n=1 Tax=Streptomyces sp. NBC_00151 TaxID=2975669 RepID=UPI002DDB7141|nr:hypothetical protein [Streptomyces sp. NBC_00151]WRZ36771.1 hypothetical protein OG915_00960 [Streptomyces sp. NBC_00151]WRZ44806.1 hypothetical protein OG915_46600 [Streptomyces sp. NBC_00151]